MNRITFKGKSVQLSGIPPQVGHLAPDFSLVKKDLTVATLDNYLGNNSVLLNIFPKRRHKCVRVFCQSF